MLSVAVAGVGLAVAWTLSYYSRPDLVAAARDAVFADLRDGVFVLDDPGYFLRRFGVDPTALHTRRPLVRACTDWTERRPHVAGALGKAILDALIEDGTLRRRPDGRALNVTRDFLSDDRRSAAA
jgi:hypothetical protein